MMATPSEMLVHFRQEFAELAGQCQPFAILCRSSRLQAQNADKLRAARARAGEVKVVLIGVADEDGANELLSYEFMLDALANELDMYVALKRDDSAKAWEHLVNAQGLASGAVKAHAVAAHLERAYIPRLHVIERLLFPEQMFASVGFIIEHDECSICGSVYGDCDHIKGRPYMGELCARVITKWKLLEVSIVEDPANKHCRILSIPDDIGIQRDPLSLEIIEPKTAQVPTDPLPIDSAIKTV